MIKFSARSHPGRVRANNEDNLYCNGVSLTPENRDTPFNLQGKAQSPCIFAVCDGMGGEANGEFASLTAVTALREHSAAIMEASMSDDVNKAVQSFVTDTNERLCKVMLTNPARMGTTLALVVIAEDVVRAYNIGDSRVYKLQDGAFAQISRDHTLAAQKVKMGLLTEEEARQDKSRHVLTRYFGVFEDEMTLTAEPCIPFSTDKPFRLLLCSDGLADMVTDGRIEAVMRSAGDTTSAVNALVGEALQNGGRDNITCIVVDSES